MDILDAIGAGMDWVIYHFELAALISVGLSGLAFAIYKLRHPHLDRATVTGKTVLPDGSLARATMPSVRRHVYMAVIAGTIFNAILMPFMWILIESEESFLAFLANWDMLCWILGVYGACFIIMLLQIGLVLQTLYHAAAPEPHPSTLPKEKR